MNDNVNNDDIKRSVFLDTETTGFDHNGDDRVIEIGAIEYINRAPTGRTFHVYIDPKRDVPEEAYAVHNLSRDDLIRLSKGREFKDIAPGFLDFIKGAELIAHNAMFDVNFLNAELRRLSIAPLQDQGVIITDSLAVANAKHPGQANNLDALLRRYIGTDNYEREFHGALLDASLLARVYLLMTVKQNDLSLDTKSLITGPSIKVEYIANVDLPVIELSNEELENHLKLLKRVTKESGGITPAFDL